ncbi:HepA Superfamily II DNA/RNA helicases, SNF2 family [Candidatus Nanopelagicaceae bacterium]
MAINFKDARQQVADAARISHDLTDIITTEQRFLKNTRDSANRAKQSQVLEQLAKLDVDKLKDATEAPIRVETLRKFGHNNMASIYQTSEQQLERISGITGASAREIKSIADAMYTAIAQTISYGVNIKDLSAADIDVITNLQSLEKIRKSTRGATAKMKPVAETLTNALAATAPLKSRIRWIFTNSEGKQKALNALSTIAYIVGEPTTMLLVEAAGSGLNALEQPEVVAPINDFEKRSSDYYALLEDVTDAKPSTLANRHFTQELLDKIESQELDTSNINATLRRYQTFGGKFALTQNRVIIGDEMGLGKTLQAISALSHRKAHGAQRFLVIAPASVIINWTREIETRSDLPVIKIHGEDHPEQLQHWIEKSGVGLTTYDTLKSFLLDGPQIKALAIDTIIADEAHYVKNLHTGRAKTITKWIDNAPNVIFLTGTPMENRVGEFVNLATLLDPKLGETLDRRVLASGPEPFKQAVAPIYLRRNTSEVLKELPDLIEIEEYCNWDGVDQNFYASAVARGNFMGMRQATFVGKENELPSKLVRLLELVEEAFESNQKVIIFSYFRNTIDLVTKHLEDKAIGPITGSTSSQERQNLVDQFQNSPTPKVLVGQIQAAGTGLNIQAASVIILCEPQIKPSLETQAIARAHRMGQVHNVQVHRLIVPQSVDEQMLKMLATKQNEFDDYARESLLADGSKLAKDKNEETIAKVIIVEERKRLGIEGKSQIDLESDE